jgi:hypothetical protein
MTRRMDWRKARLVGKPSLDFRREFEFEDRAARWIAVVEGRRQRRSFAAPRFRAAASTTVASSAEVPW